VRVFVQFLHQRGEVAGETGNDEDHSGAAERAGKGPLVDAVRRITVA
jgi:hypothetical protein